LYILNLGSNNFGQRLPDGRLGLRLLLGSCLGLGWPDACFGLVESSASWSGTDNLEETMSDADEKGDKSEELI
jgi:hypothetical protein